MVPRKVFVTGGSGFIGTNLIRLLLDQGYHVKALVRSAADSEHLERLQPGSGTMESVEGDLNDPENWSAMKGCDALFHVAAHYSLWQSDREQLRRSNVLGTRNILAAARRAEVSRVVYTSSVAAIGAGKEGQTLNESHQTPVDQLVGEYKQSKYWAEMEARQAIDAGQDIVIVNPTTPIGPWDRKPTPTGDIILRFLRGNMPFYLDTGLNIIDVDDVCWGHLLALTRGKTGRRYILGHRNMTLKTLLDLLSKHTGIASPSRRIPYWIPLLTARVQEDILAKFGVTPSIAVDGVRMSRQWMHYDSSRAVHELGLPQSDLSAAVERAIGWFKQHGYVQKS
ncbi:hopanoid-associated sugar epimerase [Aphanothece microscopica]